MLTKRRIFVECSTVYCGRCAHQYGVWQAMEGRKQSANQLPELQNIIDFALVQTRISELLGTSSGIFCDRQNK